MTSGCYTDILSFFPQSCVKETIGRRQTLLLAPKNSSGSAETPSPPISARHRQQYVVQPVVRDRSLAARNRSTNRYSRKYPRPPSIFFLMFTRHYEKFRVVAKSPAEFIDTSSIIIRRDNKFLLRKTRNFNIFFSGWRKKKVCEAYLIIYYHFDCYHLQWWATTKSRWQGCRPLVVPHRRAPTMAIQAGY